MLRVAADLLQRHRQLSMVVLEIHDLPELERVFGHAAVKTTLAIAARTLGNLRRKARAIRTAPTLFTLLLPDWGRQQAIDAVFAAFGRPCCIELEVDGQGVVLLPELAVHTVDRETRSMKDVYDDLCRTVSLMTHPRRRHHHSHQHRAPESHPSRPFIQGAPTRSEPTAPAVVREPRIVAYPPMPPTIPVALGAR